jgi:tetratricopeptide (TPR) repeat protein
MLGAELWAGHYERATKGALARQDYEAAWGHVCLALRGRPRSADLHLLAARVARQSDRIPEAQEHLKKCLEFQGGISEPLKLERMMLAAQSGQPETVLESLFLYVREDHPSAPLILEALCFGFRRVRLTGPAARCAQLWLEREPDNVQALICHGACCGELGNFNAAVADFQKALELAPERNGCRQNLALALLEMSQFDQATEQFEQVLAAQPDNRVAGLGLAQCRIASGEYKQAQELLDAILDQDLNDPDALTERGKVALALGETEAAESCLRRALQIDAYHFAAAYQLELCLRRQNKQDQADQIGQQRQGIEADMMRLQTLMTRELSKPGPRTPAVYHELGEILLRRGDKHQALNWLYKALEHAPTYQPTHLLLVDFYEKAGDGQRAARHREMLDHHAD